MRIIFLDVDGVLNNNDTKDRIFGWVGIDPILLSNLKELYDRSDQEEETRVVISSSWKRDEIKAVARKERDPEYQSVDNCYRVLLEILDSVGIEVLGHTPDIAPFYRGVEILQWIKDYEANHLGNPMEKLSSYVILDDEVFDYFEDKEPLAYHFIETSSTDEGQDYWDAWDGYGHPIGLQKEHIERALKVLRGELEVKEDVRKS